MAKTVSKEREAVKGAYRRGDGTVPPSWASKVDNMDDQQLIAVYMRLKSQNKI